METDTQITQNLKQATEIFEKYDKTIRSAIWTHINDKSSIDDIFQDFFLSLVKSPIPRKDQNIKAFIYRAIRNDVLDAASRTRSYHLRNRKYAELNTDRFKSSTPDEILGHAEEIRQLFKIVGNQLHLHESRSIIHKYRDGMDIGETAELMRINRRSVSCYLCKGLKKLRELFADK